jgi:hypothetical protein
LFYESFFATLPNGFKHYCSVIAALFRGKAYTKAYLAQAAAVDCALLPYNPAVVDLIRQAKKDGRQIYLATASDRRYAEVIAAHLGYFDGILRPMGRQICQEKRRPVSWSSASGPKISIMLTMRIGISPSGATHAKLMLSVILPD